MCTDYLYYYHCCHHTTKSTKQCGRRRQSEVGFFYSCFGGRYCHGFTAKTEYRGLLCPQCLNKERGREAQTRATQAARGYGWSGNTVEGRDLPVDRSLGRAPAGMPGGELGSYQTGRRRQPGASHPQRQGRGNNNNWPTPHRGPAAAPAAPSTTAARPVRHLPPIPAQPARARVPQQTGYASTSETMRAEPPRSQSIRAPRPAPIKVTGMAKVNQPQIVHQQLLSPQAAVIQDAVIERPARRDSNGVSEFGSEDGDSPGWRAHGASPRAVSPLGSGGCTYQPWPLP